MKINSNHESGAALSMELTNYLENITYGAISIIVQDSKVIQLNIDEVYRFDIDCSNAPIVDATSPKRELTRDKVKAQVDEITDIVSKIKYGMLTIRIKNGVAVQYEKNEKLRISN